MNPNTKNVEATFKQCACTYWDTQSRKGFHHENGNTNEHSKKSAKVHKVTYKTKVKARAISKSVSRDRQEEFRRQNETYILSRIIRLEQELGNLIMHY